jgi:hypothetical protein
MAQRNEVRGSEFSEYPVCAAEPVVIQFGKPDKWETLGFRLVRGEAEQVFQGRAWDEALRIRRSYRGNSEEQLFGSRGLGFRLVRENA